MKLRVNEIERGTLLVAESIRVAAILERGRHTERNTGRDGEALHPFADED